MPKYIESSFSNASIDLTGATLHSYTCRLATAYHDETNIANQAAVAYVNDQAKFLAAQILRTQYVNDIKQHEQERNVLIEKVRQGVSLSGDENNQFAKLSAQITQLRVNITALNKIPARIDANTSFLRNMAELLAYRQVCILLPDNVDLARRYSEMRSNLAESLKKDYTALIMQTGAQKKKQADLTSLLNALESSNLIFDLPTPPPLLVKKNDGTSSGSSSSSAPVDDETFVTYAQKLQNSYENIVVNNPPALTWASAKTAEKYGLLFIKPKKVYSNLIVAANAHAQKIYKKAEDCRSEGRDEERNNESFAQKIDPAKKIAHELAFDLDLDDSPLEEIYQVLKELYKSHHHYWEIIFSFTVNDQLKTNDQMLRQAIFGPFFARLTKEQLALLPPEEVAEHQSWLQPDISLAIGNRKLQLFLEQLQTSPATAPLMATDFLNIEADVQREFYQRALAIHVKNLQTELDSLNDIGEIQTKFDAALLAIAPWGQAYQKLFDDNCVMVLAKANDRILEAQMNQAIKAATTAAAVVNIVNDNKDKYKTKGAQKRFFIAAKERRMEIFIADLTANGAIQAPTVLAPISSKSSVFSFNFNFTSWWASFLSLFLAAPSITPTDTRSLAQKLYDNLVAKHVKDDLDDVPAIVGAPEVISPEGIAFIEEHWLGEPLTQLGERVEIHSKSSDLVLHQRLVKECQIDIKYSIQRGKIGYENGLNNALTAKLAENNLPAETVNVIRLAIKRYFPNDETLNNAIREKQQAYAHKTTVYALDYYWALVCIKDTPHQEAIIKVLSVTLLNARADKQGILSALAGMLDRETDIQNIYKIFMLLNPNEVPKSEHEQVIKSAINFIGIWPQALAMLRAKGAQLKLTTPDDILTQELRDYCQIEVDDQLEANLQSKFDDPLLTAQQKTILLAAQMKYYPSAELNKDETKISFFLAAITSLGDTHPQFKTFFDKLKEEIGEKRNLDDVKGAILGVFDMFYLERNPLAIQHNNDFYELLMLLDPTVTARSVSEQSLKSGMTLTGVWNEFLTTRFKLINDTDHTDPAPKKIHARWVKPVSVPLDPTLIHRIEKPLFADHQSSIFDSGETETQQLLKKKNPTKYCFSWLATGATPKQYLEQKFNDLSDSYRQRVR